MAPLTINISNCFAKTIDSKDRLDRKEWDSFKDRLLEVQKKFKTEKKEGYEALVSNLRAWTVSHEQTKDIQATLKIAKKIREDIKPKAFVTIGIGGSDLGARVLHGALDSTQHNLFPEIKRGGAPQIYFTGDTFEPNELSDILTTLKERKILTQTIFNVISKSGRTSETIGAFLVIKEQLEAELAKEGKDPKESLKYFVATTGLNKKSELFNMNEKAPVKFLGMLPVPDGVGGRFSFASPVGLLSLLVSANTNNSTLEKRLDEALEGLKDAEKETYDNPLGDHNIAYNLALANHLLQKRQKPNIIFYPYSKVLRVLGDWYTQLSTESIQEKGEGQNVIATSGPTGNHSILNGILNGPRDKEVLFIRVEKMNEKQDFTIPKGSGIGGELEVLEGSKLSFIQNVSQQGTEINFTQNGIPNLTILIPQLDTYHLFKLMYHLEVCVAVEGELRGLGKLTYEQSGVEGYKKEVRKILSS